ncbi:MAG: hypothetical protein J6J23_07590, partial [Clostridia bacterium]|nr:hypothetical protein [Clostridia bacterium]
MLEEIDFRRDYGEIFAEVKEKVEFIQANKLPDELIKKAQSGDNEAFEKVYFYYMPVIEYFYLKDMPWIDSDYAKKEMVQMYEDAYIKSIMTYSKNGYGSFLNCIRFLVTNAKHIGLSRISREEKNDSLTVINDVDKVAEVYGEG